MKPLESVEDEISRLRAELDGETDPERRETLNHLMTKLRVARVALEKQEVMSARATTPDRAASKSRYFD